MYKRVGLIVLTGMVLLVGCGPSGQVAQPPTTVPLNQSEEPTPLLLPLVATAVPTAEPTAEVEAGSDQETDSPPPATPAIVMGADGIQRITVPDARMLVDRGEAVLLDTRSLSEYLNLHAAGSQAFPDDEVAARMGELPDELALIFY